MADRSKTPNTPINVRGDQPNVPLVGFCSLFGLGWFSRLIRSFGFKKFQCQCHSFDFERSLLTVGNSECNSDPSLILWPVTHTCYDALQSSSTSCTWSAHDITPPSLWARLFHSVKRDSSTILDRSPVAELACPWPLLLVTSLVT